MVASENPGVSEMNIQRNNITAVSEANGTGNGNGGFLQGVSRNTLWENLISANSYVRKVTKSSVSPLFDLASKNTTNDGYVSSPSYFLMTGRKGMWVYQKGESMVAFCWHPNVDGQILLFPPVGPRGVDMLADIINMDVQPTNGFRIARVPQENAEILSQGLQERCPGLTFMPKVEDMLDWIYPVHTFSTEKLSNPGSDMSDYRKNLKVDGFMVFTQEGEPIGFNVWEAPVKGQKVANGITNISNTNFKKNPNDPDERPWKGIAELMFNKQAEMLRAAGVEELCLGGSETASLDAFKRKMAPIKTAALCTIDVVRPQQLRM